MLCNLESAPWVWKSVDLAEDQGWIHRLADTGCGVYNLAEHETPHSNRTEQERSVHSPESELRRTLSTIEELRHQLEAGRGLYLLRGLNVQDFSLEHLPTIGAWLANQLNRKLIAQNLAGDLFAVIRNQEGNDPNSAQRHGHRGRSEMLHHSDSCDTLVLMCVRAAKMGGATSVCSTAAVYNAIKKTNPNLIVALERGFFFDMTGKTTKGFSDQRLPVFFRDGCGVTCRFNRNRIELGMKRAGIHLSGDEVAALDFMSDLVQHPDFSFRFALQPGDIVFLKNARVLHARDQYEDW